MPAEQPLRNKVALALVLETERLVAQHGVAGVSLRQINQAANVRNASAVHYHFGSREALMLAVYEHRITPVNARRLKLLAELEATGRLMDQRGLVGALIRPLVEELAPRPEGNHYLRFLERAAREVASERTGLPSQELLTGWRRAKDQLRATMAYLPVPLVELRLGMMNDQIISGLASIEASLELRAEELTTLPLRVEALIDAAVAILAGPVSPDAFALVPAP